MVTSWYTRYKNILLPVLAILLLFLISAKFGKKEGKSLPKKH